MQILKLTTILVALVGASELSEARLEAHEWGTFTSLVGSTGQAQDGMYHEDEALPSFVYGFGETQTPTPVPTPRPFPNPCRFKGCFDASFFLKNPVTAKMETPVIYFYSDKAQGVDVHVRFPNGVVTETYPAPVSTSPTRADISQVANGDTTFHVNVMMETNPMTPPFVDAANIYSHARHTESQLVMSGTDVEKFIFYRGIGTFHPRLSITSNQGQLAIAAPGGSTPQAAFLVDVNEVEEARLIRLDGLRATGSVVVKPSVIARLRDHATKPKAGILSEADGRVALIGALVSSGLKTDEATAMIETWEHGYLKVPGLRLLYILPRGEVDQILPLTMTPTPEKLERVFVGRIEVLLDTEERALLKAIQASTGASFPLESLGRFAEPKLRRVKEAYLETIADAGTAADPMTLTTLDQLIDRAANGDTHTGTTTVN